MRRFEHPLSSSVTDGWTDDTHWPSPDSPRRRPGARELIREIQFRVQFELQRVGAAGAGPRVFYYH
jgi:hypothetical protein